MFALIAESTLYFKVGELNRDDYGSVGSEQFLNIPYYEVPAEVMEDSTLFLKWANNSIAVGHATAKKKRKKVL